MKRRLYLFAALSFVTLAVPFAQAQSAPTCPPISFPDITNLAKNPSFEVAGKYGPFKVYLGFGGEESAAANWLVHSSNEHAVVTTELLPTTVPIPPGYAMCSVWVFVKSGHVQMGVNSTNLGPVAWSEKHNEWEELRVCTGYDCVGKQKTPVDSVYIYNEDQKGGEFYVDRVELRRINAQ
jgi:hypothetical protein